MNSRAATDTDVHDQRATWASRPAPACTRETELRGMSGDPGEQDAGDSWIEFEDRGDHELKGVPDDWQVLAVRPSEESPTP